MAEEWRSGTYVSVWDGGTKVKSDCLYNPTTRQVVIKQVHDEDVDVLDEEYVVLSVPAANGSHYATAASESSRHEYTDEQQATMLFYAERAVTRQKPHAVGIRAPAPSYCSCGGAREWVDDVGNQARCLECGQVGPG
jgi:hypothetical protein